MKEEMLKKKYTLPGFLEVHKGDTVVDVSAFVGGFPVAVASKAILIPYNRKFDLRKMATFWIADRLPMPPIEDDKVVDRELSGRLYTPTLPLPFKGI